MGHYGSFVWLMAHFEWHTMESLIGRSVISMAKALHAGICCFREMKPNLIMAAILGWFASAQAQPTNSFPLWPEGARGAGKGGQGHPHADALLARPGQGDRRRRRDLPGGGYGGLATHEGRPLCTVPQRIRHRGVCFEIPAGFRRLPASGHAARCGPRGAVGARPGGRMEAGSQTHRHHGIFSRRPPCFHAADAL